MLGELRRMQQVTGQGKKHERLLERFSHLLFNRCSLEHFMRLGGLLAVQKE